MAPADLKSRRRNDYKFHVDYRTRWHDDDVYGHMNNSIYYHLFDSIVNTYLTAHCALHPPTSPQIGLVVHSHCDYFATLGFPAVAELGLRVNKLGKSSVTYEIGVFERGDEDVRAVGEFVHVFVERDLRRPEMQGMGDDLRRGLEKIVAATTMTQKSKL